MCGRYASTRSAADLAALFGDVEDLTEGDLVPDYNIAPTDPAPIVRLSQRVGGPALALARWGFLPPWARDAKGAARMINARAETVATSRAYGEAFTKRRCLVPADGWYEWRVGPDGRTPFFLNRAPGPVVFGGLWSAWGHGADMRITFSIVTTAAVGALATVHDRMPMVLDESRWSAWLSGSDSENLLTPPTSDYCSGFELRPVSPAVGDVRKDGPELVRALVGDAASRSTMERSPTLF